MRCLIYQYWIGQMRSGVLASKANMEEYARRIGVEYRFDRNPNVASRRCDVPIYYECLNPLFDESFAGYDRVLSVDMDMFAVDGLTQNIFEEPIADVGICTEPHQPAYRATLTGQICKDRDEKWARIVRDKWAAEMPRNEQGLLKVYNTGVIVFTASAREKFARFAPFQEYIDAVRHLGKFYTIDQNYFHAMMVKHLDYTELDNGWNSYVHYIGSPDDNPRPVNDMRTQDTKFVHIQLRGADDFDAETLSRITNLPRSEWRIR